MQNRTVKTKAIVLKETQLREADKILVCLSSDLGRITVSARGVRTHKSKNIAAASFLAYSDMLLYHSREMYALSQSSLIDSFFDIRKDITRLTYASYFADILLDSMQENEEAGNVMKLFLNILHYLAKPGTDPVYLASLFEIRLLNEIGYTFDPEIRCAVCGNEKISGISILKGAFVCGKCMKAGSIQISFQTAGIIKTMIISSLKQALELRPDSHDTERIKNISSRYLTACLDKRYTKLDFLNTL